jgi:ABC-2 type transport system ATP-binding protein
MIKMAIIEVDNLTKTYNMKKRAPGLAGAFKSLFTSSTEKITAVNSLSFQIDEGDVVAYIGHNGAGKSTSIKLMTGILAPTSGNIVVNGIEPFKHRRRLAKDIGVIFGQRSQLLWDIPVIESFKLQKDIYRVSNKLFNEQLELFDSILDIGKLLNISVRQLSLGQRMRAEMCVALLHNPKIVFMDEPTIGLDVMVKKKLMDFIIEINKRLGTTIVLTTHDMSYLERVCNKALIIQKGQIIYYDYMDKLKNLYSGRKELVVTFKDEYKDGSGLEDKKVTLLNQQSISIECTINSNIFELLNTLSLNNEIVNIEINSDSLEDFIVKIHQSGG